MMKPLKLLGRAVRILGGVSLGIFGIISMLTGDTEYLVRMAAGIVVAVAAGMLLLDGDR